MLVTSADTSINSVKSIDFTVNRKLSANIAIAVAAFA